MVNQESGQPGTGHHRSEEEIRAELFRIIDSLASARTESPADVRAKYDEAWKELESERTLH